MRSLLWWLGLVACGAGVLGSPPPGEDANAHPAARNDASHAADRAAAVRRKQAQDANAAAAARATRYLLRRGCATKPATLHF